VGKSIGYPAGWVADLTIMAVSPPGVCGTTHASDNLAWQHAAPKPRTRIQKRTLLVHLFAKIIIYIYNIALTKY
jgi:hypothetical protein